MPLPGSVSGCPFADGRTIPTATGVELVVGVAAAASSVAAAAAAAAVAAAAADDGAFS